MPGKVQRLMFCITELLRVLTAGIMQSAVILVIALVAATFSQGRATRPGASLNNDLKKKKRSQNKSYLADNYVRITLSQAQMITDIKVK